MTFNTLMYNNASRFIDHHTMVWMRKLSVPSAKVWETISTKDGLDNWWLCPVEIDLRIGGKFSHHWVNTIIGIENRVSIDFGGAQPDSFMRFELQTDGDETVFYLIDSFTLSLGYML